MQNGTLSPKVILENNQAGAATPADMGTTGLVSWVLSAPSRSTFTRWQTAVAIVRRRHGANGDKAALAFARATVAGAERISSRWWQARFTRYAASLAASLH